MTQQQLAEILGVNFTVVSQYEHDRRNPKRETLRKIAAAIGVPEWELTGDEYPSAAAQDIKKEPAPESGLDELDIQLLAIIRTLSADQKQFLLAQLQTLQANPRLHRG